ncbi:MAG: Crp/Fnr family transcriptional regulator [Bacteroidetes bacterium 4484_276]|nr:MAG: Crp/Fnr family transcriptional regulator [Bacteroidetes bacterium 4484_276]OYT12848.1 MAG: Crp/Fnr family transcriptional regulator [Bacteroidetes bacterium 4572_114]
MKNSNKNNSDSIINTSGCFQTLDSKDLEFLNNNKTQITYLKGETIFKQGAFAPHVLYVNSGLIRVYLQTGSSKQINIRLVNRGNFIVFSSIFDENIYTYSAAALKDSTICMIDKEALKQLLLKNPEFAMRITSKNYQNESRYLEIITNVSYKQMRGKLASALLYLSADKFSGEDIYQYLTRQDIADFASITVESAIKFIKEFEKEGILFLDGKKITIRNIEALAEINLRG